MGNGASGQGNVHPHDQGDVGSSVAQEQHDWQPESAVSSRQETLSLQSTRKSYSGARTWSSKLSTDDDAKLDAYSSAQQEEDSAQMNSDTRAPTQSSTTEKDDGDEDLETDLRESRAFDDVIVEQEVSEQDGVATDAPLPDVRLDQPMSSQKLCMKKSHRISPVHRKFL